MEGRQIITDSESQQQTILPGHLLFLPKDIYMVSDFIAANGYFEAILFFIDDTLLANELSIDIHSKDIHQTDKHATDHTPATAVFNGGRQIADYIQALLRVYNQPQCNTTHHTQALASLKILELFHLLAQQEDGASFTTHCQQHCMYKKQRDIRAFMHKHYTKNLTLDDYAQLTGRSVSTFIRDFKKLYHTTPNQWIIEMRLKKAHALLSQTQATVTDAAFEVGYENVSHFISAYKAHFHYTPKKTKQLQ